MPFCITFHFFGFRLPEGNGHWIESHGTVIAFLIPFERIIVDVHSIQRKKKLGKGNEFFVVTREANSFAIAGTFCLNGTRDQCVCHTFIVLLLPSSPSSRERTHNYTLIHFSILFICAMVGNEQKKTSEAFLHQLINV